jgi:hypothetical protein
LETFNKLYLLDLGDLLEEEEKFTQEYQKALSNLEKINLGEKLKEISDKIKSLERQKKVSPEEKKKLEELNEEFRDLSSKLVDFDQER